MDKEPILTESPDLLAVAHKRAPIEIWEEIFSIAVESPLISYLNDDILDAYLLFSTQCASQRIQKRVEAIRNHLRLVCRSWNACLRDKGVKLVISSSESGSYQRLEVLDAAPFAASAIIPDCVGSILYPATIPLSDDQPASALANLRIAIISNKCSIDAVLNAPRLRALHVSCSSLSTRADIFLSHRTTSTLSHLQLSGLSPQVMRSIPRPVKFAQLRLLSLRLMTDPVPIPPSNGSLLDMWLLPCLQTLVLTGRVNGGYEPDISKFLSRLWTGVTSLYVDLTYVTPGVGAPKVFEIHPRLWASFPNLVTFGIHPSSLVEAPPAPPGLYPRFSLALEFVWDAFWRGFTLRGKSVIPFIQVLDEWKPVNITFFLFVERNIYWS